MNKKIKATYLLLSTLVIISLFLSKTVYSQDSTYNILKPVFVQTSLLYDFPISYGITTGISYPLKSIVNKRILKNGKLHTKQKDMFWGGNLGVYRYPYNYTGVLVAPFIGMRHFTHKSFFLESSFSVGLLKTFYDGKVYQVDASGNVKEKSLFGRLYATTHFSSAFNFMLQKSRHPMLALQIKPTLWFQYPFNGFIKPHVSLEASIKYEINTQTTTIRTTTKYLKK